MKIKLNYGAISDTLEKQLNKQGFTLGKDKDAEKFEKIKKAINMCGFHVATDSQVNSMFKKFHKLVMESIKNIGGSHGRTKTKTP